MNKLGLLIAILAFTLVSCTNQNKKKNEETTTVEETIIDSHTSEISLDWAGVYEGTMPCASCEGIETVIELKDDHTYVATYNYISKPEDENTFTNEGTFTWNDDGNSISLLAEDELTQYRVGENQIMLLNADGELNTGELAEFYVLKKKM